MRTFIFTCGDINGIGPEIVMKTINKLSKTDNNFIVIMPQNVFESVTVKPEFSFNTGKGTKFVPHEKVYFLLTKKVPQNIGTSTKYSGEASFKAIQLSYHLLKEKKAEAVITAPISKHALNLAGIKYPGHTEIYADWCGVKNYLMMFLSDDFNAALNSIHIPVKDIPKYISKKILSRNLNIIINTLKEDLGINYPRIAVLGLNPHSGEEGLIGKEEKRIISKVISEFKEAEGPFSPDAFYAVKGYRNYDLVFGMYHDQVLIPFKMLNFNKGVNFTAGLPIVRTSPDHGTAFDIAGKGVADESSMLEAYRYAEIIVKNRNSNNRW